MSLKVLIFIGTMLGSLIGGYIPALWGDSFFSYTSVLLSGVGGILGIWLAIKLNQTINN